MYHFNMHEQEQINIKLYNSYLQKEKKHKNKTDLVGSQRLYV